MTAYNIVLRVTIIYALTVDGLLQQDVYNVRRRRKKERNANLVMIQLPMALFNVDYVQNAFVKNAPIYAHTIALYRVLYVKSTLMNVLQHTTDTLELIFNSLFVFQELVDDAIAIFNLTRLVICGQLGLEFL